MATNYMEQAKKRKRAAKLDTIAKQKKLGKLKVHHIDTIDEATRIRLRLPNTIER